MAKEKKKEEIEVKDDSEKIDLVMSFILMKKLVKPIRKTKAYNLGIVDRMGKQIKKPETKEEKDAYSILDKLIFKIKRLMGSRLAQLNVFMYLQGMEQDFTDNIRVMGGIEKRGAVKRVKDDMERMLEKYDVSHDEFFNIVLMEEMKKKEFENEL